VYFVLFCLLTIVICADLCSLYECNTWYPVLVSYTGVSGADRPNIVKGMMAFSSRILSVLKHIFPQDLR